MPTRSTDKHIFELECLVAEIRPYGDESTLHLTLSMTSEMIDQMLYILANHETYVEGTLSPEREHHAST